MEAGKTLIELAGNKTGSFYRLAKEIDLSEATINKIRKGDRKLPLQYVPRLAEIAGENPTEWLMACMAERERKPERKAEIVAILGKGLAAGVVGISLFSPASDSNASVLTTFKPLSIYTSYVLAIIRRLIMGFAHTHPKPYGARLVGALVAP